jgi:hypothetical protein
MLFFFTQKFMVHDTCKVKFEVSCIINVQHVTFIVIGIVELISTNYNPKIPIGIPIVNNFYDIFYQFLKF